jgi:hypothetical protein
MPEDARVDAGHVACGWFWPSPGARRRTERRGWPRVPFVGLIEAYVLRVLRELNFTMPDVRRAADLVRSEFDDPYGLASQRIATNGVGLFVRVADDSVDTDGKPAQLRLPQYPSEAEVIVDPRFGLGAPVLAKRRFRSKPWCLCGGLASRFLRSPRSTSSP